MLAQFLCVVFGLVGAVPLGIGLLVRTSYVRAWAASETAAILQRELGLSARYRVHVEAWPLAVGLEELVVDGSDGLGPALEVSRITVRPRLFSLIAGKLDAGDIEIDGPRARLVVHDGQLENVRYRLPQTKEGGAPLRKAPFTSIAVTDARIDLDLDGVRVRGDEIDLDVSAQDGPAFDIAVRGGKQLATWRTPVLSVDDAAAPVTAVNDDVLCQLEARLHVDPTGILVRRLDLTGAADLDPAAGTSPGCELPTDDPRRVVVSLSHVRVARTPDRPIEADGHVVVRAPVALTNRFVPFLPLTGWIAVDVDGHYGPGHVMPELRGTITGRGISLERYRLGQELDAEVAIENDAILVNRLALAFADGTVVLNRVSVEPFKEGIPLHVPSGDATGVRFSALMRDLGVTPHAHVAWNVRHLHLGAVEGKLAPLRIDGELRGETSDFEVFDRATDDPLRRHMIGVREAKLGGRFSVKPDALVFAGQRIDFGESHVETTVSIGFHNDIALTVGKGTAIDLADISPLADLKLTGKASLTAEMHGKMGDPVLVGDLSIQGFSLAGFPIGDITQAKARFQPLTVDFTDVHAKKNKSAFEATTLRLDFNGPATVLVDADVDAPELELRDFFHMWHFDADPRFSSIEGHGRAKARIHYDLGGALDRCGGGALEVRGGLHLATAEAFEEHYDAVDSDFEYRWLDRDAQDLGMDVDLHSLSMKKGRGSIVGSGTIRRGGLLRGTAVADDVPISRLQALGPVGKLLEGSVSAVATVSGTLDQMEADADVRITPVKIGTATLPASRLRVQLAPEKKEPRVVGHTRCGAAITPPFDRAEFDRDLRMGTFHTTGQLFGGQIALDDWKITRQTKKIASGTIVMSRVDLGAIGSALPAFSGEDRPKGRLSGTLEVGSLSFDAPEKTAATLSLDELDVSSGGGHVALRAGTLPIRIGGDRLALPDIALDFAAPSGLKGTFVLAGQVKHVATGPDLDLAMKIAPTDLSAIAALIPRVERAAGVVDASLSITGKPSAPTYAGAVHLKKGELSVRGLPALLSDVNVDVVVGGGEVRIVRAQAAVGGGTLSVTGNAPIRGGLELGDATAAITARGVHLAVSDGLNVALDADLAAVLAVPKKDEEEHPLPRVTGDVVLTQLTYTRPITLAADIGAIAQRGRKLFESYDPADDLLNFDLRVRAREPMKIRNNLIDAQLAIDSEVLTLAGTNQRFGMRGQLRVLPAGRVRLRANEFEVRQGYVRFDDLTRVAPKVDVTAVTEYRRYSESQASGAGTGPGAGAAAAGAAAGGSGGVGRAGGSWRITLHAYGDAENLRLEMTSDPALAQEDIALLLYIGMTRAEIDQLQASSLGETAALEALSTLTGADSAVKTAVPVIDDFRFGNAYSSRTGRTEPTVTVGKRVTEQVRANVTSGLSENREIRSNLEWRLGSRVSVQGSYDNVNDVSSSALGNLGADVRYRLEFE